VVYRYPKIYKFDKNLELKSNETSLFVLGFSDVFCGVSVYFNDFFSAIHKLDIGNLFSYFLVNMELFKYGFLEIFLAARVHFHSAVVYCLIVDVQKDLNI
jgi:hypothetical protein